MSNQYKRKSIEFYIDQKGCHICTSHPVSSGGYPLYVKGGKNYNLHRFVWEDTFGKISPGLVVRHKCNNKLCINLDHLCLGTIGDNVRDSVMAGTHKNPILRGESNGSSKLSENDIKNIRQLHSLGLSQSQISKRLNGVVGQPTISMILSGKRWSHVDGDSDL